MKSRNKKKSVIIFSVVLAFSALVSSQGYVIQDVDRPIGDDVNFFDLSLEIENSYIEAGDQIVLTAETAGSGEPVEGVELYIEDEFVHKTGSTGTYHFSLSEPGTYEVRGEIANYEDFEEIEVLESVEDRYTVQNQPVSVSGNFFLNASNLQVYSYIILFVLFVVGYLQHLGKINLFKKDL